MKHLTDAALVVLAKTGSSPAFSELCLRYQHKLSCYIRAQTRYDESLAEDVVQDAFVKAWRKLYSLKEDDKFFQWMVSICRNISIDYVRDKQRTDDLLEIFNIHEEETVDVEYLGDMDKLLIQLNDEEREITVMKAILEFSFDEIAEILNISVSASKMRYYRSIDKLKTLTNQ